MRGWIGLAVVLATTARAGADPAAPPPAPAAAPSDGWRPGFYFEPSMLVSLGTYSSVPAYVAPYLPNNRGAIVTRLALGMMWRDHEGGEMPWRIHTGAVVSFASLHPPGASGGLTTLGLETEADRPISDQLRVGLQLGAERGNNGVDLFRVGARLHVHETAWVGVDAFHLTRAHNGSPSCSDEGVPDCSVPVTGVMAGAGLEGKTGAIVGVAGVAAAAILVVIAIASFHVPQ